MILFELYIYINLFLINRDFWDASSQTVTLLPHNFATTISHVSLFIALLFNHRISFCPSHHLATMALSFCSNNCPAYTYSLHQNLKRDIVVFPQRKKPRSSSTLSFSNTCTFNHVDPLILQTNDNDPQYSFFSNPTNDNSNTFISALFPKSVFPLEYHNHNLDNYSGFQGNHYSNYPEFFFNNGPYSPNYPSLTPEYDNHDVDQLLLAPLIGELMRI